jgi:hypothetical protein
MSPMVELLACQYAMSASYALQIFVFGGFYFFFQRHCHLIIVQDLGFRSYAERFRFSSLEMVLVGFLADRVGSSSGGK